MKKILTKIVLTGVLFTLYSTQTFADEHIKNLQKSFKSNQETVLAIDTKYGDVVYKNWDKDSIVIDIEIKFEDSNIKPEDINIATEVSESRINIKTEFNTSSLAFKEQNWYKQKNLKINYFVKVPSYIKLELDLQYGNLNLMNHYGNIDFKLQYTDGEIGSLNKGKKEQVNKINLSYSDIRFQEVGWIKIISKYSDVIVDNAQTLIVLGKYSDFKINNVNTLLVETNNEDYEIHSVKNMVTNAAYTEFKINQLMNKLDFKGKYSDLNANWVDPDFENININSTYGNVKLGIDASANYNLEGEAKYCNITYPDNSNVKKLKDGTTLKIAGLVGNINKISSRIDIYSKYGNVDLTK